MTETALPTERQWQLVAKRQQAEIRKLTIDEKLDRLSRLMSTVPTASARAERQRRVDETRQKWVRLKQAYDV